MTDQLADLLLEHENGPMAALDTHLAYWEWSRTPGRLEDEYRMVLDTTFKRAVGYINDHRFYASAEREFLNRAKTCFITAEMMDVAFHEAGVEWTFLTEDRSLTARRELHLDETRVPILRREMLPVEEGFLVLGKPFPLADYDMTVVDTEGPEALNYIPIRAFGWKVAQDVSSMEGPTPGLVIYCYTRPLPRMADFYRDRYGSVPPLIMIDFSGWAFNKEFLISDSWSMDDEARQGFHMPAARIRPHVASIRMFLASVFGLMNSYIEKHRPTRPQMKRAKRLDRPEDGDVRVLHLRKFLQTVKHKPLTAEDYDEDGNPRWSHRWIVRGHWAWRACKCHPEGRHRVYIDPYVKGPEHLPLVIKEKVLSLDR